MAWAETLSGVISSTPTQLWEHFCPRHLLLPRVDQRFERKSTSRRNGKQQDRRCNTKRTCVVHGQELVDPRPTQRPYSSPPAFAAHPACSQRALDMASRWTAINIQNGMAPTALRPRQGGGKGANISGKSAAVDARTIVPRPCGLDSRSTTRV